MRDRFIESLAEEFGLPVQVQALIKECMSEDSSALPAISDVVETLRASSHTSERTLIQDSWDVPSSNELRSVVGAISDYICDSADVDRHDRLFPADPLVFFSSPLSVAYGAVGIAYALSRIHGNVPEEIMAWILRHPIHPADHPPGLYVGSSGIAWAFWELGLEDVALQTMRASEDHPVLWDDTNIFHGASGYGLACLRFYLGTGHETWLDRAIQVGERLLGTRVQEDGGQHCYWPDKEGNVALGYARGTSGTALFLLYLGIVAKDAKFIEAGKSALDFVLSHARHVSDGHFSIPRGAVGSFESVLTHYWEDGTAGVAGVVARFLAHTGDTKYSDSLDLLAPDTFRKFTIFPSLFLGLSGLGNFLLDAWVLTGNKRYLSEAQRVANGVLLFKIERSSGIAFPGEQLLRISTDFGTGSAGIALFLHRLAGAEQLTGDFNFTLDHLLGEESSHRRDS